MVWFPFGERKHQLLGCHFFHHPIGPITDSVEIVVGSVLARLAVLEVFTSAWLLSTGKVPLTTVDTHYNRKAVTGHLGASRGQVTQILHFYLGPEAGARSIG